MARFDVRIQVDAGGDALGSLQDWLAGAAELRGRVRRARPVPRREQMGAVADVLVAAVGSGGAISALAASLGTWLVTRRDRVTIKVTGPDDHSVEVDLRSGDVETLLRRILPDPDGDTGGGEDSGSEGGTG